MMDQGLGKFQLDPELVAEARERLHPHIRVTPVLRSGYDPEVVFKAENLQVTGAFKIRTSLIQILNLSHEQTHRGLVACSSGNFAIATAYAAKKLGFSAKIVMPQTANPVKVERTRRLGAEVVFCDDDFDAEVAAVARIVAEENRSQIEPSDHQLAVVAGATVGLEILEQYPQAENIAVPIGGGGLISGVAAIVKALKPSVRVWGVQAEGCQPAYLSFHAKTHKRVERPDTIADGLKVARLGDLTFPMILDFVDEVLTVPENCILGAVRHFVEEERLIVEPAGAVTFAAVQEGKIPRKRTALILSGGNISRKVLLQALATETDN